MTFAWDLRGLALLLPGLAAALAVRGSLARRGLWGLIASLAVPATAVVPWAVLGLYRPWLGAGGTALLTAAVLAWGWRQCRRAGPDPAWREDPWPDVLSLVLVAPVAAAWAWSHPWPPPWNGHYMLALQTGEWLAAHGAFPSLDQVGTRFNISPVLFPPLIHGAAAVVAPLGRDALVTWATVVGKFGLVGLALGVAGLTRACGLAGGARAVGVVLGVALALAWGPNSHTFFLLVELTQDTLICPVAALLLVEGGRVWRAPAAPAFAGWCAAALVGWVRQPLAPLALGWWMIFRLMATRRRPQEGDSAATRSRTPLLIAAAVAGVLALGWSWFLWLRYGSPLFPYRFGTGLLRGLYPFEEAAWQFFQGPGVALYPGTPWETLVRTVSGPPGYPLLLRAFAVDGLVAPATLVLAARALVVGPPAKEARGFTALLAAWLLGGLAYWFLLPGGGTIKPLYILLPAVFGLAGVAAGRAVATLTARVPLSGLRGSIGAWLAAVVLVGAVWRSGRPHMAFDLGWPGWWHPPVPLQQALGQQYGAEAVRLLERLEANAPPPDSVVMFNYEHSGLCLFLTSDAPLWSIAEYRTALYPWHVAPDFESLRALIAQSGKRWLFAPDRDYLETWIATSPQMTMAPEVLVLALYDGRLAGRVVARAAWRDGFDVLVYDLSGPAAAPPD